MKLKLITLVIPFYLFAGSLQAAPNDACQEAAFDKALFGLCQAYTSGMNCLEENNREHPRCISLRQNFLRKSGKNIDDLLGAGSTTVIGDTGGKASLDNVAEVSFPAGAFAQDTPVRLQTTSDDEINTLFNEFTVMFRTAGRIAYELRIDTGNTPPLSEFVTVNMNVPDTFSANLPGDHALEVFAMIEQGGSEEIPFPIFELLPSSYDSINQTLSFELPGAAFSNSSLTNNAYQAVVTISATPGARTASTTLTTNLVQAAAAGKCEAASISCPVAGGCDVTSPYNKARKHPVTGELRPHYGTDYKAANGTVVNAAANGKVERSYTSSSYGETIIIRHSDGGATLYAHLEKRNVNANDTVSKGKPIGTADNTGLSTGPHLHFEYVPNGQIIQSKNRIDPDPCIDADGTGSVTVRDSGSLADDAFQVSIDGFVIGQTSVGASNTLAISNLKPGQHTLTLKVLIAPDNVGTYTVTLNDGLKFSDNTTSKTGYAAQGATISWSFIVPDS